MVCGGFSCSKNCLCALNLLYTLRTASSSSLFVGSPGIPSVDHCGPLQNWSACCSLGLLPGASALG
uniref:Tetraspanin 13 n=1 Tax=Mus musculus TaxID=10090 RepID=A0A1Y7VK38_MOUSE